MKRASIDLNADVGEGFSADEELVPLVSSVNIACGAHAGDEGTMRRAIELALRHGAAIGAHPGFADRENFGRKELSIHPAAAAGLVLGQARMLRRIAERLGARVGHVKLHGALYNMAARDRVLADAVCDALASDERESGQGWVLVTLPGSPLMSIARGRGLRVVGEAFADRSYRRDGTLAPRGEAGAVISDVARAARQAVRIAMEGIVAGPDGGDVKVEAETLCVHGDGPDAAVLARRIRDELVGAGVAVTHF